ncbi:hypothetical protein ALI22I_20610 [Saccharothrix sp. ALI-22-I]|uniref:hypothetical protein n=1 Tax=Saccharothrix sp. ALI-22-I TaxID=1933778 RepID=UPI00097C335C|nr:hypothetical protein [Saccharothrix sp. ALI-22-I]ONI88142.1 hypothetical protein ALI22I_20610 [Saccharothrix sp. ALI-22-I]
MRLLDERRLNDILPENAPRLPVMEPARDTEVTRLMRRILLVVAALVLAFALAMSLWSGSTPESPDRGPSITTGSSIGPLAN